MEEANPNLTSKQSKDSWPAYYDNQEICKTLPFLQKESSHRFESVSIKPLCFNWPPEKVGIYNKQEKKLTSAKKKFGRKETSKKKENLKSRLWKYADWLPRDIIEKN